MVARSNSTGPRRPRRLLVFVALAAALVGVPIANAGLASNGAGGCGQFKNSVDAAANGDGITPMFNGSDTARNSEGAVVTKNISIEGRWTPPGNGCPGANVNYPTAVDMLAAGFTYGGPNDRAILFANNAPVITVSTAVKQLSVLYTDFQVRAGYSGNGGAILADGLTGARLKFQDMDLVKDPFDVNVAVSGNGGGMYLDIDDGSNVTIDNSTISELGAGNGGGFNIIVRGGSSVSLRNLTVTGNSANGGSGGGGRIILYSGYVTITNSLFSNNQASVAGGGLRIERPNGATGPAVVWLNNTRFSGNTALTGPDLSTAGNGLTVYQLNRTVALPLTVDSRTPGAQINRITRTGNTYSVGFTAVGFTPQLTARHVHFFFDTVTPAQAGMPGSGPWFMYAGTSPFTGYGVGDRPPGATRMCILVANADHSVIQNTGNCLKLP